jgi:hypothetical protein
MDCPEYQFNQQCQRQKPKKNSDVRRGDALLLNDIHDFGHYQRLGKKHDGIGYDEHEPIPDDHSLIAR